MSKGRIIITFVLLGFAVFFGIGVINSLYEVNDAQKELEQAEKELADANKELAAAKLNVEKLIE